MGKKCEIMMGYFNRKLNVDFLKIIQLGLTFMDSQGKSPPGVCSYQFNCVSNRPCFNQGLS